MSKKITERLPKEVGTGLYPVKSPWDKMISYHDAAHYCQRYTNVVAAASLLCQYCNSRIWREKCGKSSYASVYAGKFRRRPDWRCR